MGSQDKQNVEQSFRESLEDILRVAEKLLPYCQTVEELIGMVKPALENDAQLRLLIQVVMSTNTKR